MTAAATAPDAARTARAVTEGRGKAAGFVQGFDGLRAIAALLVVVDHVGQASGFTGRSSLGRFTARGEIGVSVFFLISGFLLYRPFAAAALAGRPGPNVRSYLVRRVLRIVPLYWVALVVNYLFTGWKSVHGVSGFLENAFFLQVYSRHWVFHGITQAWSLCIEVTFYLALPLWAVAMRRLDRRRGLPHDPAAVLRRELLAPRRVVRRERALPALGGGRRCATRAQLAACRGAIISRSGWGSPSPVRTSARPARCQKRCAG